MRKQRLTQFSPAQPGGVAILTLPLGPTYERLKINLLNGLEVRHITMITGKVNGRAFFTIRGEHLQKQNLYDGLQSPDDVILIDFTQPNAKSSSVNAGGSVRTTAQASEMLFTCLPSVLFQTATFEFELDPAAPATGSMEAWSQESDPTRNAFVIKSAYSEIAFPSAQENDIPLPVGPSGAVIKQLHFHLRNSAASGMASGQLPIDMVEIRNGGVIIFEGRVRDIQSDQIDYGKVPQPNLLTLDFFLQGFRDKLLNTTKSNSVFVRLKTTLPTEWTLYTRYIDPVGR